MNENKKIDKIVGIVPMVTIDDTQATKEMSRYVQILTKKLNEIIDVINSGNGYHN